MSPPSICCPGRAAGAPWRRISRWAAACAWTGWPRTSRRSPATATSCSGSRRSGLVDCLALARGTARGPHLHVRRRLYAHPRAARPRRPDVPYQNDFLWASPALSQRVAPRVRRRLATERSGCSRERWWVPKQPLRHLRVGHEVRHITRRRRNRSRNLGSHSPPGGPAELRALIPSQGHRPACDLRRGSGTSRAARRRVRITGLGATLSTRGLRRTIARSPAACPNPSLDQPIVGLPAIISAHWRRLPRDGSGTHRRRTGGQPQPRAGR